LKGDKSKVVVFENLRFLSVPLIFICAFLRFRIYYFKASPKVIKSRLFIKIKKNIELNKLEGCVDFPTPFICDYDAIKYAQEIFDSKFKNNPLLRKMAGLSESDVSYSSYKKRLTEIFYRFFWVRAALIKAKEVFCVQYIIFFPEQFIIAQNLIGLKEPEQKNAGNSFSVKVLSLGYLYASIVLAYDQIIWIFGFFALPLLIVSKIRKIVINGEPRKKYQLAIRVYKTDLAFYHKYRTIDFLLDGIKLNKNNSIFCIETEISDEYQAELNKRNYYSLKIPKILHTVSLSFIWQILIKKVLIFWILSIKDSFFTPAYFIKAVLRDVYTFVSWERLLMFYEIEHYVAYNDYESSSIIRNIVLANHKVKTWYYLHSRDFGDSFMLGDKRNDFRWRQLAYFNFENFVTFGNAEFFLKKHPNHVKRFWSLGCLWSEHVRLISKDKVLEDLNIPRQDPDTHRGGIVGVFNTDFGENVPLKLLDLASFIDGILSLLEKFPELTVVFKEKYPRIDVSKEILPYFRKLENHPRCFMSGDRFEAAEIISISDLIIGACFTSPVIEALGAGRKAIFFDSLGRFVDTHYDQLPNFVAHNMGELYNLIQLWLYNTSVQEFDEYLQQHVKKRLDLSSDCKAITRFRELLTRRG